MTQLPTSVCALALLASLAGADQLSLPAARDNTLYEDPAGGLSNGMGENFYTGRTGAGGGGLIRRGLIAFDLSAIPVGSTINSVTLRVHCSQANTGSAILTLQRALSDWGEGSSVAPPGAGSGSGVPATAGDATWLHTFWPASFWTAPGGDFSGAISGSVIVSTAGAYTFPSQAGMIADVRSWLDGSLPNFGWCMVGDESTTMTTKRFETRESSTIAFRPLLTVNFTPPTLAYCTAKTNSLGCIPAIAGVGVPSASSGSGFVVSAAGMRNNKAALLFYGSSGRSSNPFQGGWMCVAAPVRRTVGVNSGGNPLGDDCSGLPALDLNAFAIGSLGGHPAPFLAIPGSLIDCQFWGRDDGFPTPDNTSLSDALEFMLRP